MPRLRTTALVLYLLGFVPAMAFAQASITGIVRDASGAVLPGVTVEATSPDLIGKVRTAVTDGSGAYRIVDLRAGTYGVTFSLTGFSTVRREGIVLEGAFTATVNADLRLGALEETITVTGETPIVDVQSVKRQMVLDNDMISAIPSSRSYNNLIQLIPNSINQAGAPTDVQVVPGMVVFGGFGGRSNEGRVNVDGLSVGSAFNGAGVSSYIADVANAREISMSTTGGLGETEGGGPALNVLPKEGGNSVRGTFFGAGVTSGMVGSNYTQELRDRGLTTPGETRKVWDFNLGIGGPIAPTGEYPLDGWDQVIAINLSGVFYGMRYQIPAIQAAGGGAIVNMSSILGQVGLRGSPAYVAAKHGLVGLTRTAALEYAPHRVRINVVGPAFIRTPLVEHSLTPDVLKMLEGQHPIGRLGTSEEVAELTLWLCSDKASFVTGSYYAVDGGYLAQ